MLTLRKRDPRCMQHISHAGRISRCTGRRFCWPQLPEGKHGLSISSRKFQRVSLAAATISEYTVQQTSHYPCFHWPSTHQGLGVVWSFNFPTALQLRLPRFPTLSWFDSEEGMRVTETGLKRTKETRSAYHWTWAFVRSGIRCFFATRGGLDMWQGPDGDVLCVGDIPAVIQHRPSLSRSDSK